jgi:hypothetical protein
MFAPKHFPLTRLFGDEHGSILLQSLHKRGDKKQAKKL